jgi:hypothetical protein
MNNNHRVELRNLKSTNSQNSESNGVANRQNNETNQRSVFSPTMKSPFNHFTKSRNSLGKIKNLISPDVQKQMVTLDALNPKIAFDDKIRLPRSSSVVN